MKRATYNRKGVSAILVIQLFVVMMVLAFMTLNLSNAQRHFTAAQIASDLASRWGVDALSRTDNTKQVEKQVRDLIYENWTFSESKFKSTVQSNRKNLDVDVLFGNAKQVKGQFKFQTGARPVNSVKVNAQGKLPTIGFLPYFSRGINIQRGSTAMALERDLCLVIDRSGSMNFDLRTNTWMYDRSWHSYNKLSTSRNSYYRRISYQWWQYWPHPTRSRWSTLVPAVYGLANELNKTKQNEMFSIVSYSSSVRYTFYDHNLRRKTYRVYTSAVESQPTEKYETAAKRLDQKYKYEQIVAGATNISAGIDEAIKVLTGPQARPNAYKTMIVMTDGQYNQGRAPWIAAADAARKDIEVYTVTFSTGADQATMRKTAANGNGKHFHAPNGNSLEAIFREIANIPPAAYIE